MDDAQWPSHSQVLSIININFIRLGMLFISGGAVEKLFGNEIPNSQIQNQPNFLMVAESLEEIADPRFKLIKMIYGNYKILEWFIKTWDCLSLKRRS